MQKEKIPVSIHIIVWVLLITGLWILTIGIIQIFSAYFLDVYSTGLIRPPGPVFNPISMVLLIINSIAMIIAAIGIRNMRKWEL